MKLPSISKLIYEAKATFFRFPFVIIMSALSALFMIWSADLNFEHSTGYFKLINAAMASSVGISFLFAISIFSENRNLSKFISYTLQAAATVLLIIYFYTLSGREDFYDAARFMLYLTASHLLVSFAVFKKDSGGLIFNSFWDYNLSIFIRILFAAFYSIVLYAGLAIAVLSFDKLFNVNLKGVRYLQLFFLIAGIFNTWFFLSGVPEQMEKVKPYPNAMKVFTQYVALPIVVIYLVILYLYTGKIIIQWELPVGWVSNLIIGFSIAGIFSLLLIHPLRNTEGNFWIGKFSRVFYFVLIPLIILLFIAITTRIKEYGITENRYFVFITAVWLSGITLYNIFSTKKNIKIIPITLFLFVFLSSFGPWGAFSLSLNNQLGRLEELFVKNNILQNGKVVKVTVQPENSDIQDIYSIINYLRVRNQYSKIQRWFDINLDTTYFSERRKSESGISESRVLEQMGIEYKGYSYKEDKDRIDFNARAENGYEITGYNYYYSYTYYSTMDSVPRSFSFDSVFYKIEFSNQTSSLSLLSYSDSLKTLKDSVLFTSVNIYETLKKVKENELLILESLTGRLKVKMLITDLGGEISEDNLKINRLSARFLIAKPR